MIRVLVVDDSVVFRTQISEALKDSTEIEVVGTAPNGSIALQKLQQLTVDVVILDMEMPDMNGTEVLREIKKQRFPVHVIIFSSQTSSGAESALLALREGADDVIGKPTGDVSSIEASRLMIRQSLTPRVLQFKRKSIALKSDLHPPSPPLRNQKIARRDLSHFRPSILVIGSSTGGPTALEKIFQQIQGPISIPIVIVQHMPPLFTELLAKRLETLTGIPSAEAKMGEKLKPNRIYVAPGDYHVVLESTGDGSRIVLNQSPQRNSVRPAVDYLFETAASIYKESCLGIVLTGMGEDGLVGAKAIRSAGGAIVIQDKESCVVFGMPGAVFEADEYDQMGNLDMITLMIKRVVKKENQV